MYRSSTKIKIASAYNYGGYPNTQFIKKVDFGLKTDQLSKNALNDIHAWSMNSWHDACGYITWLCKPHNTFTTSHSSRHTHTPSQDLQNLTVFNMSLNVRSSISPAPCICGIFLLWCRFQGHFFSFLISPEILGSLNHSPSFGSQSTTAVTCLFRCWVVYPSYMDWRERWVKGVRCTCNWNVDSMQWRPLSKEDTEIEFCNWFPITMNIETDYAKEEPRIVKEWIGVWHNYTNCQVNSTSSIPPWWSLTNNNFTSTLLGRTLLASWDGFSLDFSREEKGGPVYLVDMRMRELIDSIQIVKDGQSYKKKNTYDNVTTMQWQLSIKVE